MIIGKHQTELTLLSVVRHRRASLRAGQGLSMEMSGWFKDYPLLGCQ